LRTRTLFENFGKRLIFYGNDPSNHVVLKGSHGQYEIFRDGSSIGQFQLPLPGLHNALNATAATIAAMEAGAEFPQVAQALQNFGGVGRRFQKRGEKSGIAFFDDYGHHPTEIEAVLSGFREKFADRRLVVLFQPHRYSRTQLCWSQFLDCFEDCDQLYLLDIYAAGEKPMEGVNSQRLATSLHHKNVTYLASREEATLQHVAEGLKAGDIFITLGAGDVWKIGDSVQDLVRASR
jgi:UDP-N-acetylmuramate--alanine ligase